MINLRRFPLPWEMCRSQFDTDEDYYYAQQHYDELYNEAEDIAMEDYYEKKYNDGQ